GGRHSLALLANGAVVAWVRTTAGSSATASKKGPNRARLRAAARRPSRFAQKGLEAPCPPGPDLMHVKGISAGEEFSLAAVQAPPTVTAISPNAGPKTGGTAVKVTGAEFSEAIEVKFGSAGADRKS